MEPLVWVLEQERIHLDRIRYHTTLALLMLRSREARFLPRVVDDLHDAVDDLGDAELQRAALVAALAVELLIPDEQLTLTELIARADDATAGRLRTLQQQLRSVVSELTDLTGSSTVQAATELDAIRRSLGRFSGLPVGAATYGVVGSVPPARFDVSL